MEMDRRDLRSRSSVVSKASLEGRRGVVDDVPSDDAAG